MFNSFRQFLRTRSPFVYGTFYFFLIPLFAFIYLLQPDASFKTDLDTNTFVTCLYFSTVTITTLGFGDISPVSTAAQWTVIIESIIGLFTIGLFLNALAQAQSARITNNERAANAESLRLQQIARLLRFDKLIQLSIHDYLIYTWAMTTPITKRNDSDVKVNPDFVFSDMADLFGPSLLGADLMEPVINIYFKKQTILISDVKSMIINMDMTPWPKLEEACQKFLENCNAAGIAEGLMEQGKNDQLKKMIENRVREENDNPEYYTGGNMVNPVIVIYRLIKQNLTFLQEYQLFIDHITSDQQPTE